MGGGKRQNNKPTTTFFFKKMSIYDNITTTTTKKKKNNFPSSSSFSSLIVVLMLGILSVFYRGYWFGQLDGGTSGNAASASSFIANSVRSKTTTTENDFVIHEQRIWVLVNIYNRNFQEDQNMLNGLPLNLVLPYYY